MKILIVLTYYRPHISGLTIYAERLAKAFAARGHQVTILTSQFEPSLPREEVDEGVKIVRVPVWFRLSKGVIMPSIGFIANRLVKENDVIQLHLPQFDAAGIAIRGRLLRKPTVTTYHCDLNMPAGILSKAANWGVDLMNLITALFSHRIVTYTQDYADHSKYLHRFLSKVKIIPPPVVLPVATKGEIQEFNKTHNPKNAHPVIGMAARFATEKGVEVLLNALPEILRKYPNAKVQFVGPYQNIIGEEKYLQRLMPIIQQYEQNGNWEFVGSLEPKEMAAFYPNLDVLVVPSLNSTEAFGLVQIEAMMNGIPCVTSNLPGVRQPVIVHKMGKIFEIGDAKGLAGQLLEILDQNGTHGRMGTSDFACYTPADVAHQYEILFGQIFQDLNKK
ncbi:MAG: glycosyltransferase family 4 protein [Anaerolineaceae bacterium]